jgi:SMI1 / KNR4 family (SUKH-1)
MAPGLTLEEIEEKTQDLPFQLSGEVKELYQWRNGGASLFFSNYLKSEGLYLFSLEKAIEFTRELKTVSIVTEVLEQNQITHALCIFRDFEGWLPFLDCCHEYTSPVLVTTDDQSLRFDYTSLTNMVLTAVECYEREILTFNQFGGIHLDKDIKQERAYMSVFKKNNPDYDLVRQQYGYKRS